MRSLPGAARWRSFLTWRGLCIGLPVRPECNEAIEHIARSGKQDWKGKSGYHRRSLVENLMYRFKTLTGDRLWARDVQVQDAEVAVRVGIINRMLVLARPKSVRIA